MKLRWIKKPASYDAGFVFIESNNFNGLNYHVYPITENNFLKGFRFLREDGNGSYEVLRSNNRTTCSCPSFTQQNKNCKHIKSIFYLYKENVNGPKEKSSRS